MNAGVFPQGFVPMRSVCLLNVSHEESTKLLFGASWEPRGINPGAYHYRCFADYALRSSLCLLWQNFFFWPGVKFLPQGASLLNVNGFQSPNRRVHEPPPLHHLLPLQLFLWMFCPPAPNSVSCHRSYSLFKVSKPSRFVLQNLFCPHLVQPPPDLPAVCPSVSLNQNINTSSVVGWLDLNGGAKCLKAFP